MFILYKKFYFNFYRSLYMAKNITSLFFNIHTTTTTTRYIFIQYYTLNFIVKYILFIIFIHKKPI